VVLLVLVVLVVLVALVVIEELVLLVVVELVVDVLARVVVLLDDVEVVLVEVLNVVVGTDDGSTSNCRATYTYWRVSEIVSPCQSTVVLSSSPTIDHAVVSLPPLRNTVGSPEGTQ